jgi:hypothetical protein
MEGMRRLEFELFADYFQFYLQDESADGDLEDSWTDDAVARLLAVAPGAIAVGTVRNMDVPVAVEVLLEAPMSDLDSWDHVTECSLDVPSGRIVIAGCTDYRPDAARIDVGPGTYRARISYGSLSSLSEDGLDGDDHYRVQLWQAPAVEPRVLRQRVA